MKPRVVEDKTPILKHLFARINELKLHSKFKSYGSSNQIRKRDRDFCDAGSKSKLASTSFRFFSSSTSPRKTEKYSNVYENGKKRKTVYSGFVRNNHESSDNYDYKQFGYFSDNISRSLKNCSGRSSQTDHTNLNFHMYIQNELIKRRNVVTERENNEPITRIIVRDLNKNKKDPQSLNSDKQFPKIRFGKFKGFTNS